MNANGVPVSSPSPMPHFHMPWRGIAVVLLLMVVVGAFMLAAAFAWPGGAKVQESHWVDVAATDAIPVGAPVVVSEQRLSLVKLESGEILALWRRDTQSGCTLSWRPELMFAGDKGWFRDPCHGATYTLSGQCVAGPCPRDMDRYAVKVQDVRVLVDTSRRLCGAGRPPIDGSCVQPKPANPSQ